MKNSFEEMHYGRKISRFETRFLKIDRMDGKEEATDFPDKNICIFASMAFFILWISGEI